MIDKRNRNGRKLYLIGIDSTPLWIIDRLCKGRRYRMDGFRLFRQGGGLLSEIKSTVPPVTSTAWPTIYTGLEPGEHRIVDFATLDRHYGKRLLYYDAARYPPFWDVLAARGFECLVVAPAVALQKSAYSNVDMITGWPLQPRFSSREVERTARALKYDGEPDIGNSLNNGRVSLGEASRIWTESTDRRARLAERLMERKSYDMGFVCFTETDRIQHYSLSLGNWEEYVAPLYERISDFMLYVQKRIERNREDAMVMMVSDHGAQRISHKFLSNSWMVHNNYAALKGDVYGRGASKPQQKGIASKMKGRIIDMAVESNIRREIYAKLPKQLRRVGEKLVEDSFDYETQGRYTRITESDFDMPRTRAFCSISTGIVGMVLINDSRFASPCVSKGETPALKKKLMKEIAMIKDLGGRRLVKDVYDGEECFPRGADIITPDLIFELRDGYTADFTGYSKGTPFARPEINRRGEHTHFGVLGIRLYNDDAKIKRRGELELHSISPTILEYFGVRSRLRPNSII